MDRAVFRGRRPTWTLTWLAALLLGAGGLAPVSPASAAPLSRAALAHPAVSDPDFCPGEPDTYQPGFAAYETVNGVTMYVDEFLTQIPKGNPPGGVPGVILVHGGGWHDGNFSSSGQDVMAPIGECLADNGYDAFSIDYTLTAPGGPTSFPQNLADIHAAIGWLPNHVTGLNTGEMFILGTSAGANLAELAGENAMGYQDGLAGVIAQSGPADLAAMGCTDTSPCPGGSPGHTIDQYLECTATGCPALYEQASPTYTASTLKTSLPPYLIANSTDEAIPLAQATGLAKALEENCGTYGGSSDQLVALPGDQHASAYADILAEPTLSFLHAVVTATLPGCQVTSPLTGAAMAYDPAPGVKTMIRFGGCCTSQADVQGTAESYDATSGTWQPVPLTSKAGPAARIGATLAYDPGSGGLLLFGGEQLPGNSVQPTLLDDTWELSYSASGRDYTWTQVGGPGCQGACSATSPPAVYGAAAAQAPTGQGVVLIGGEDLPTATEPGPPQASAQTWLWRNGNWTQLATPSGLLPRYGSTLALDSGSDADVLFGGDEPVTTGSTPCGGSCLSLGNDTWTLNSSLTWTAQTVPAAPPPREFASAAPAPGTGGGVVLSGGLTGITPPAGQGAAINQESLLQDTWTWSAAAGWTQDCAACAPPPAFGASLAGPAPSSVDLLYGGYSDQSGVTPPAASWLWTGSTWTQH